MDKKELLVIGFHIMNVEENRKYRLHQIQKSAATSDYIKVQEPNTVLNIQPNNFISQTKHIFLKTKLNRGRYVIVPTTFKPGESTEFLLRVFTDSDADLKELKKDEPEEKWYKCCASPPVLLTRVKVTGAAGLENNEAFGSKSS